MRCLYLSSDSKKKCTEMEKAGMPSEISDFDYEHFCNGNPVNCYYFRKAENEKTQMKMQKQADIRT